MPFARDPRLEGGGPQNGQRPISRRHPGLDVVHDRLDTVVITGGVPRGLGGLHPEDLSLDQVRREIAGGPRRQREAEQEEGAANGGPALTPSRWSRGG